MTADQIRAARALAESDTDLSQFNMDALFGCACADFKPVYVELGVVARQMRYQCSTFAGTWDERQYEEDALVYRRKVRILGAQPDMATMQMAFEFGFKAAERGENVQEALEKFQSFFP